MCIIILVNSLYDIVLDAVASRPVAFGHAYLKTRLNHNFLCLYSSCQLQYLLLTITIQSMTGLL